MDEKDNIDITYSERDPEELVFRELAEHANDAILLRSHKNTIYVNPAFEKIFGYKPEIIYRNYKAGLDWIFEEDKDMILSEFRSEKYLSTFTFDQQYRVIRADGTLIWIWHRSNPVYNSKGDVYRVVDVASDISQIKSLEDKLRKSKFQQQAILDNIPHLAWLKDKDGRFISANQSFCRFFNKELNEIIGKTDFDFCPRALAEDYLEKDMQVLHGGKPVIFYEIEDGENGKRYSETIKTPVFNENNEVIGISGISIDITEKKLSEKALLESEEKYRDLVTLLPEIIFETDETGKVTFVNLKAFDVLGYTPIDVERGVSIFDIIAPEDIERANDTFAKIKTGTELGGNEYTILTADGKRIRVMVFTNSLHLDGKWLGLRGVAIDITKRKQAEEQEREYQSRMMFLSETALDFLEMTREDNIFEYTGSKIKELIKEGHVAVSRFDEEFSTLTMEYFSVPEQQLNKEHMLAGLLLPGFNLIIHQEHIEILKSYSELFYNLKEGLYETTFHNIPRPICNEVEKILKIRQIMGMSLTRGGKLYGVVLLLLAQDDVIDKTLIETFIYQASIALHRRQLENELVYAKVKAEESDKLKTAFIANMSHEIRTPMNGILGLSQLLHNPNIGKNEKEEYLSLIDTNGKILLNLVNDIIDISRIESNQVDLHESLFSVDLLFNDLVQFFRSERTVKKKESIEVYVNNEIGIPDVMISGDLQKIRQVLTNFLSNAIKFTISGRIDLGCRLFEENQVLFYVRDTGIGIPEEQLGSVFNRFTQVDQSLTRPYGGSGLGLAISKGFVERMNGKIWAESNLNEGSVFYFSIPCKPLKEGFVQNSTEKVVVKQYNWSCLCILVVEDNYASFKLLQLSLQKTGVKILHAEDGITAVEMVEKNPDISLVLMDIQLPLMNGYDATRKIKALRPDLHVIAQTANATDSDRLRCMESGCSEYIAKPINLERLHQLINKFLLNKHKENPE